MATPVPLIPKISEPDSLDIPLLLKAMTALKKGDFSARLPLEWTGLAGKIADTFNYVVEMNERMARELERLCQAVAKEGKIDQRAIRGEFGGSWLQMMESVNTLIDDLARPTREMSRVIGAVAKGDLSQEAALEVGGRPLEGEFLQTGRTINTMVDRLRSFTSEVTRVAREVGTEGKLGGQAIVPGVAGTWKDLADNVNLMAGNLTSQVRNIAEVTLSVAQGDLSKKITADVRGEVLVLKETVNTMVDQLRSFASEVSRVAREVGTEGKLGGQAQVPGAAGTWKDLTENVNFMASNLTSQVRNIAEITLSVAQGDLSKKITADVRGEVLVLKETVNTMVDQLRSFASEVTRVAREVGTEGKLGGQAQVPGAAGTWKELTDNVNHMAANLTDQVRSIAKVVSSVAQGDLKQKLTVVSKGEMAALADTINIMVDQLNDFAAQVTNVAREVGVEGRLGGQANVPGAAGTWKDLTDNVNQLAANLTTQVRAIAEVAMAVTQGDLTRSIHMDARGEVEKLKDTINQMIANLSSTTQKNTEQVWLKTNLARFTLMLQGQRDLPTVANAVLSELHQVVSAQYATFYIADSKEPGGTRLRILSSFAYRPRREVPREFGLGEGLVGQCAQEKTRLLLNNVPGNYIRISSSLGEASPLNLVVLPVLFEDNIKGVLELASFEVFTPAYLAFLEQLMESLGIVIHTLEANLRTETLLKDLQSQQEELRTSNQELEEKADQLALTSKYKSEFLSNMSHELRTPLNSMMILSEQLAEDPQNLTPKQVEYARTIHASGGDLLLLINDILDLAKVESGTMTLDLDNIPFTQMREHIDRVFRHVAESRGLQFSIEFDPQLGAEIHTDSKRLEQVLINLLSNAFKFTQKGQVYLKVAPASGGWSPDHPVLSQAEEVIAFSVTDTGIGIPLDKQKIIFEAFQQAESGTSRKYGGTGLGLSISREMAKLLGGQLTLANSHPGRGSSFVLYMPQNYAAAKVTTAVLVPAVEPELLAALKPPSAPVRTAGERILLSTNEVADDRKTIQPGDKVLLIIENDASFARILLDMAREKGFRGLVALRGEMALLLAQEVQPSAVTLDIQLPDIDGWNILAHFKNDLAIRHIPVEIISVDKDCMRGLKLGALGCLAKPVTKEDLQKGFGRIQKCLEFPAREVLLLCANPGQLDKFKEMLEFGEVKVRPVADSREAMQFLKEGKPDCLVLELPSPDGFRTLQALHDYPPDSRLPIIVYISGNLTKREEEELRRTSEVCVLKEARSPERLVDDAALFLHQVVARLPEAKRNSIEQIQQNNAILIGRRVLVVDDDIRNIFAMTSLLERQQMRVLSAESGREALELLEKTPDMDIVLMDIMMPEMDGYAAIQAIRRMENFKFLPVIALTAKAMKGDREKCIEAGASDYITKPVDTKQLLALMRTWLNR